MTDILIPKPGCTYLVKEWTMGPLLFLGAKKNTTEIKYNRNKKYNRTLAANQQSINTCIIAKIIGKIKSVQILDLTHPNRNNSTCPPNLSTTTHNVISQLM